MVPPSFLYSALTSVPTTLARRSWATWLAPPPHTVDGRLWPSHSYVPSPPAILPLRRSRGPDPSSHADLMPSPIDHRHASQRSRPPYRPPPCLPAFPAAGVPPSAVDRLIHHHRTSTRRRPPDPRLHAPPTGQKAAPFLSVAIVVVGPSVAPFDLRLSPVSNPPARPGAGPCPAGPDPSPTPCSSLPQLDPSLPQLSRLDPSLSRLSRLDPPSLWLDHRLHG
jgi:hypothetical protein